MELESIIITISGKEYCFVLGGIMESGMDKGAKVEKIVVDDVSAKLYLSNKNVLTYRNYPIFFRKII